MDSSDNANVFVDHRETCVEVPFRSQISATKTEVSSTQDVEQLQTQPDADEGQSRAEEGHFTTESSTLMSGSSTETTVTKHVTTIFTQKIGFSRSLENKTSVDGRSGTLTERSEAVIQTPSSSTARSIWSLPMEGVAEQSREALNLNDLVNNNDQQAGVFSSLDVNITNTATSPTKRTVYARVFGMTVDTDNSEVTTSTTRHLSECIFSVSGPANSEKTEVAISQEAEQNADQATKEQTQEQEHTAVQDVKQTVHKERRHFFSQEIRDISTQETTQTISQEVRQSFGQELGEVGFQQMGQIAGHESGLTNIQETEQQFDVSGWAGGPEVGPAVEQVTRQISDQQLEQSTVQKTEKTGERINLSAGKLEIIESSSSETRQINQQEIGEIDQVNQEIVNVGSKETVNRLEITQATSQETVLSDIQETGWSSRQETDFRFAQGVESSIRHTAEQLSSLEIDHKRLALGHNSSHEIQQTIIHQVEQTSKLETERIHHDELRSLNVQEIGRIGEQAKEPQLVHKADSDNGIGVKREGEKEVSEYCPGMAIRALTLEDLQQKRTSPEHSLKEGTNIQSADLFTKELRGTEPSSLNISNQNSASLFKVQKIQKVPLPCRTVSHFQNSGLSSETSTSFVSESVSSCMYQDAYSENHLTASGQVLMQCTDDTSSLQKTSSRPVEVERKFTITNDTESRLQNIGAKLRGEKIFTDAYFDNEDYSLILSDCWLRRRNDSWEAKVPLSSSNSFSSQSATQYHELTIEKEISAWLVDKLNLDTWMRGDPIELLIQAAGLSEFARFTTTRRSYVLPACSVDLDLTDHGFRVGEIEVMAASPQEVPQALSVISNVAKELGKLDKVK